MNMKIFKNKFDSLVAKELANRVLVMLFAVVIAIEGLVIKDLINKQRVIVMPSGNVVKEFWIAGDSVSESYLEQQARDISGLLLTANPKVAKKQFFSILPLIESVQYNKYKNEFTKQARYLVDNDISTVFYSSSFKYEKNLIVVSGVKNNIIGNKIVTSKNLKFEIAFKIQHGRFYIKSLKVD